MIIITSTLCRVLLQTRNIFKLRPHVCLFPTVNKYQTKAREKKKKLSLNPNPHIITSLRITRKILFHLYSERNQIRQPCVIKHLC